jgi:hypothetical protein
MTSFFAWLDHSEHERRRMLDVIDLFREQETRDELGLGTIRDAFADQLFPGTSTIQTRARYFLFIPWIYRTLEGKRITSGEIVQRARRDEVSLINALAESADRDGVIGIEARDRLKRLPSAVYWQGLGVWGIRTFPGSQDQYHRAFDRLPSKNELELRNDDNEPVEGRIRRNWDPRLPPMPSSFPQGAAFPLSRNEAEYLRDRIAARCGQSLLAWLVDRGVAWEPTAFPWQHPQYASFPDRVRELLQHARNFSETTVGAAWLYNLMLAETSGRGDDKAHYRERLGEWASMLAARENFVRSWDESRFWELARVGGARIGLGTQSFVSRWLALSRQEGFAATAADEPSARQLIHTRERDLKGGQARLDNRSALDRWSGAAGAGQISYRWAKSQGIVLDILRGLAETKADA